MAMISNVADYFSKGCGRCKRFETADCSTQVWAEGLAQLRQICLSAGLEETVKWGHPCYTQNGRNIAIIGAFRDNFRLTFFNAELLKDDKKLLQKRGENTACADMLVFTNPADVTALAPTISAYVLEAKSYAEAGKKPKKERVEIETPEELTDAFDNDPTFAEAFHALTPGRQRSYLLHLASAKTAQTRINRIGKFRDAVMAGKGFNER